MAWQLKYSEQQYEKWLSMPITSDFGCSEDKAIDYFMTHAQASLINGYGVTKENLKSTYIPIIKKYVGSGSWVLFLAKCIAEGANGPTGFGWINQTYRSANGAEACKQDCIYMRNTADSKAWGLNQSSNLDGVYQKIPMPEGEKFWQKISTKTVGCHYMQATLAGNACLWANSVAAAHQWGNPYDHCIDMIKAWGGDPWDGKAGNSGQGSAPNNQYNQGGSSSLNFPKLPRKVYLNNSKFEFLGVKFKRYGNWLYITYPWDNLTGSTSNSKPGGSGSKPNPEIKPSSDKVKKVLDVIKYEYNNANYSYSFARPAGDPHKTGTTDCSGFVGFALKEIYPDVWNGGFISTQPILSYMRNLKSIVWSGNLTTLKNFNDYKPGDLIFFGEDPDIGPGPYSHVAIVGDDNDIYSQEPGGPFHKSISFMVNNWWTYRPYAYVARIK